MPKQTRKLPTSPQDKPPALAHLAPKANTKQLKVKILLPLCGNGGAKTAANGGEKKKYNKDVHRQRNSNDHDKTRRTIQNRL